MDLTRQLELEAAMVGDGHARSRLRAEAALDHGRASMEKPGHSVLIHVLIDPLVEAFQEWLSEAYSGTAGYKSTAARELETLEPETVAFLTTKVVVDGLAIPDRRLTSAAIDVGASIEGEINARAFKKMNGRYFRATQKHIKARTANRTHIRQVYKTTLRKKGMPTTEWETSRRLHVGAACIVLLAESTGVVRIRTQRTGAKTTKILEPTPLAVEILEGKHGLSALTTPSYLPTVVPPKAWSGVWGGGYFNLPNPLPLVKTGDRTYLEQLDANPPQPEVYAALNAIQNTGWKINAKVFEVFDILWEQGISIGKLPAQDPIPLPPKPHDIATNKEARFAWRKAATQVYHANLKLVTKRIQIERIRAVAREFLAEPAFYFPHNLDFRGRAYALPLFLNPQGSDLQKGLLTFAEGAPIEDERALGWLFVHGANTYGFDKASLEDRVAWCEDRLADIVAAGRDPLGVTWWQQADSPFMFLAFCCEVAEMIDHGWGYVSHLPVMLDATCSG